MKNIILLLAFILLCASCNEGDDPICCVSPPVSLSLHVSDIEGAGTSEIEHKYFPFKVSMYYFSKTGVKTLIPRGWTHTKFKEVKILPLQLKNQGRCHFRVENCLSLHLSESILKNIYQEEVKRLFVKVRQDIDTIDLTVKYNQESYIKYEIKNFRINGKTLSPLTPDTQYNPYYFSKSGETSKISCLPENTHLNIVISDAHLVKGLVDDVEKFVEDISKKNRIKVSYKQEGIEKFLALGEFSVFFRSQDDLSLIDYETCISCRSVLKDNVTIVMPMKLLELATSEGGTKEFLITLNDQKTHKLTVDRVVRIPMKESKLKNLSHDEFIVKRVSIDGIMLDGSYGNTFHFSETWKDGKKKPWKKWDTGSGTQCKKAEDCS